MSYDLLRRELKNGILRGLYLFYGPEEYLIRHYAGEIEKLAVEPFARDVSFSLFEGKTDLGVLHDACNAYPMTGARRLVVLKDSGLLKQGSGGRQKRGTGAKAPPSGQISLGSIIDDLPEFTCLLIIEDEADKRLSLYKQISEKGLAVEFSLRTAPELEDWARAIAGRDGKMFTRDALRHFIAFSSGAMTEIRSELDKLLMYAADRPGITLDDIKAVCAFPAKARIFGLIDSLLAGDKMRALAEMDALLGEREQPARILTALSSHFVLLRQIKGLADGGMRLRDIAGFMGLNQYRAEILWRQCARVSPRSVARAIEQCRACDAGIKSGAADGATALRLLTASINI